MITGFSSYCHMAGTQGNGVHVSNALTAIYMATGQDTAWLLKIDSSSCIERKKILSNLS